MPASKRESSGESPAASSERYDHREVESRWYAYWTRKGYFKPSGDRSRPAFSMVMPPPNVTGILHLGHALNNTWQDILARHHRMAGDDTLWIPGTDHAGIHTQIKVDELLRSQGRDRRSVGREAFVDEVWAWKERYGSVILEQLQKLGVSADWSRLRFTLDEGLSRAVTEVFVELYEEGLIYRGDYITNWCVSCRTALSDVEVDHQEDPGQLTTLYYPLAEDPAQRIAVATTRPETMLGDTAVAVHPEDPRWQGWIGKMLRLPLVNRLIPVVADAAVDPDYGTGAVKVTPAHDPNDFEIGLRHQLDRIKVIDETGHMTEAAGAYQGLSREEARGRVVADLDQLGLVGDRVAIVHAVGHCEKCDTVLEPLLSRQWFVSTKPLAGPAKAAVDQGLVRFVPERFERIFMNWMENIHDWCISRQLWWGHRIPAYYCDACEKVWVARTPPDACESCHGPLRQEEDVLDTWFSSALWPFSTMGWPEATEDLARYYPTNVLSTGYDIIFFWVARMVMQGLHFTAEKPFDVVLLHGLVRDSEGRKMSKSLGNGVDPIAVIEKYGADALRMGLLLGAAPGNDMRYAEERVAAAQHFANKVYNAVRFVRMNLDQYRGGRPAWGPRAMEEGSPTPAERWILSRLASTVRDMTEHLQRFEFGEAARAVYDFLWDDFCDWYIELAKPSLKSGDEAETARVLATLVHVMDTSLRLLHPIMPFVTEELWQTLPHQGESIMVAPWPTPGVSDERAEEAMRRVQEAIRTVRNLRAELGVAPGAPVPLVFVTESAASREPLQSMTLAISTLAKARSIQFLEADAERPQPAVSAVIAGGIVYLPLTGVVDLERERARLSKAVEDSVRERDRLARQLENPEFIHKAPSAVVEKSRATYQETLERLIHLRDRLEELG